MSASHRLTAVLERTLAAKAAQASPAEAMPSPAPPAPLTRDDAAPDGAHGTGRVDPVVPAPPAPDGRPRSRATARRRTLVATACVVVAMSVAGAFALVGGRDDDRSGDDVATATSADPPAGWLVPGWMPDGWSLWGVSSGSSRPVAGSDPGTISQLLGDPQRGRALYITSHNYEIAPPTAEDVAVRGTTGSAGTGWGTAEEDLGRAIRWEERGVDMTALYRGATRAEAIAVLDALSWRSDDPRDGFAPPADDAWPLRAEAVGRTSVERQVSLRYSDGVPDADARADIRVHASSGGTITAGYLEKWFLEGDGDGSAPVVTYHADRGAEHELTVHWPDGRSATVAAPSAGERSVAREEMERIATSVAVTTASDLDALRADVGERIRALPVVVAADTRVGALAIHGAGDFLRLCLRRSGDVDPICTTAADVAGSPVAGTELVSGEWTVDGAWHVAVATRGPAPRIIGGHDRTSFPDAGELPAETVTVDDWTFRIVEPGPDVESVCTEVEGDGGSCLHVRPD